MSYTENLAYEKLKEGVHLPAKAGPALEALMDTFDKYFDVLMNHFDTLKDEFYVNTALGDALDSVGALMDLPREGGQTDSSYRTDLINYPSIIERSTVAAVENVIEDLIGIAPDVDEYPTVNFIDMYGADKNEGVFRVLIPGNKEQYFTDAEILVNNVKAAGIRAIVELGNQFFEAFTDQIIITEFLRIGGVEYLTGSMDRLAATIGEATIGTSVIASGWTWTDGTKTLEIEEYW